MYWLLNVVMDFLSYLASLLIKSHFGNCLQIYISHFSGNLLDIYIAIPRHDIVNNIILDIFCWLDDFWDDHFHSDSCF